MKLTVLMDNNTYIDQYYLGEPAVSYYLEEGDVRLLFDAGYSDAFLRNAQAMGISLTDRRLHTDLAHLPLLPYCRAKGKNSASFHRRLLR